jgi:hypothetical protein
MDKKIAEKMKRNSLNEAFIPVSDLLRQNQPGPISSFRKRILKVHVVFTQAFDQN